MKDSFAATICFFTIWLLIIWLFIITFRMNNQRERITTLENNQCSTVEIFVEKSYDKETGDFIYRIVDEKEINIK